MKKLSFCVPVYVKIYKFQMPHFSVFGDTVNIAALMESTSEPMRIQMSHATQVKYELDDMK